VAVAVWQIKRCKDAALGWQLKLIDVGVSRAVNTRNSVTHVSGTYAYMPPEVREALFGGGSPKARLEGDIYSLGLVIYDLWSGTLRSVDPQDAPRPHSPRLPAPPALEQLLRQCANEEWSLRPSAEQALEQVLQAESQSRRSRCAIRTHEGKYVCAEMWTHKVVGDRDQVGGWERWKVAEVGDGKVKLKSYHGLYLVRSACPHHTHTQSLTRRLTCHTVGGA
jgi:serine/threonine protein kinase